MRRIHELMSKKTQFITPQTRLIDASRLMVHQNVAMLPVNENGQMRGVLTEHDIISQVFVQDKDFKEILTQEVMSPKNYYCYASEDIEEAMDRMEDKHVSRLFVLNEQDQLIGELHSHELEEAVEEVELEREVEGLELEGLESEAQRRLEGGGEVVTPGDRFDRFRMERALKSSDIKLSELIHHAIQGREEKEKIKKRLSVLSFLIFFILGLFWFKRKFVQDPVHEF